MNDDAIIRQRIAGRSVRAIAKTQRRGVAEINAVIDRWSGVALTAEAGKHGLAVELARLDELRFSARVRRRCRIGALVEKIIARRCVMLGLHAPQTAVLKIVDEATAKEMSTDRIERALNAPIEDQNKNDPTTH